MIDFHFHIRVGTLTPAIVKVIAVIYESPAAETAGFFKDKGTQSDKLDTHKKIMFCFVKMSFFVSDSISTITDIASYVFFKALKALKDHYSSRDNV